MQALRRDLLLMRREINPDPKTIEREVTSLDLLLRKTESADVLFRSFELMDLNKFKIMRDSISLKKALKPNGLKAFQFLVNRN